MEAGKGETVGFEKVMVFICPVLTSLQKIDCCLTSYLGCKGRQIKELQVT
ncbi:MAG: hypothetical protein AB7V06_28285 [Candidatus Obscuribacterales bacterium]